MTKHSNPIRHLEPFYSYQDIDSLWEEFFRSVNEEENIVDVDSSKRIISCLNHNEDNTTYVNTYEFKNHFKNILSQHLYLVKQELDLTFITLEKQFKENYIDLLFRRIQNIIIENYESISVYPFLLTPLRECVKYINDIHLPIGLKRLKLDENKFEKINSEYNSLNSTISYFKSIEYLKPSFFRELYDETIRLDLIDDRIVKEEDFVGVFTEAYPHLLQNKIQFIKNIQIVVYYLDFLKPFFDTLSFAQIEKSEGFLNKDDKLIKAGDLYTAKSRSKEKNSGYLKDIADSISFLKGKHLK